MDPKLPTDEDTNDLFDDVVRRLEETGLYTAEKATKLVHEYYRKFTDKAYCGTIGIPVQNDDFFHHESGPEMARRVHYFLTLKGDPNHMAYVSWRSQL